MDSKTKFDRWVEAYHGLSPATREVALTLIESWVGLEAATESLRRATEDREHLELTGRAEVARRLS